jgi:hypothetical protein
LNAASFGAPAERYDAWPVGSELSETLARRTGTPESQPPAKG